MKRYDEDEMDDTVCIKCGNNDGFHVTYVDGLELMYCRCKRCGFNIEILPLDSEEEFTIDP